MKNNTSTTFRTGCKLLLGKKGDILKGIAWLNCEVTPGMFENEVAIEITTADGSVISFFISPDVVKHFSNSQKAIPVEVVEEIGDFGVVALPRRTFEGPSIARVRAHELRFA